MEKNRMEEVPERSLGKEFRLPVLGYLGGTGILAGLILFFFLSVEEWWFLLPPAAGAVILFAFLALNQAWLKELFQRRRTRAGTNVIILSLAVVVIWGMLNWINNRKFYRYDMTGSKEFALSDKTKNVLQSLEDPLKMTFLFTGMEGGYTDRVIDLLEEYAYHSDGVEVKKIDIEQNPEEAVAFHRNLGEDLEPDSVIIQYKGRSKHVPKSDMQEYNYSQNPYEQSRKFVAERAFTQAILELTEERQTTVYFTTGHKELDPESFKRDGLSEIAKFLKRDNIKVEKLEIEEPKPIPEDCHILVACGPQLPFTPAAADRIDRFLRRGGRFFFMASPNIPSGLEEMLKKWGVEVHPEVIIIEEHRGFLGFAVNPLEVFVIDYPLHEITEKLEGIQTSFFACCEVKEGSSAEEGATPSLLLESSKYGWGEASLDEEDRPRFDEGKDVKGPVSFGVTSKKSMEEKEEEKVEMRLIALGSLNCVANVRFEGAFPSYGNREFFLSCINWLAGREKLLAISPKEENIRQFSTTRKQEQLIKWISVAGIPFLFLLMGAGVWLRRRR